MGPRTLRVLVVDDDPLVARSLCRALHGHDVEVAHGGEGAADRIVEGGGFDLILCDLMMPGLTGMDVYERVMALAPRLGERFVFMTGGAFTARASAFLAQVPNERLEKPFDLAQVRALLAGLGAS